MVRRQDDVRQHVNRYTAVVVLGYFWGDHLWTIDQHEAQVVAFAGNDLEERNWIKKPALVPVPTKYPKLTSPIGSEQWVMDFGGGAHPIDFPRPIFGDPD